MDHANRISISDELSLEAVSDVIRDGYFQEDDLRFDENGHVANLTIWKIDDVCKSLERRMLLVIENVSRIEIGKESAGPEPHPIGGIRELDRSLRIETYDGVTVSLFVDGIKAMLELPSDTRRRAPTPAPKRRVWQFSIWRMALAVLLIAVWLRFSWGVPFTIVPLSLAIGFLLHRPWIGLLVGVALLGAFFLYVATALITGWERP